MDLILDKMQLVPAYNCLPRYPVMLRDMAVVALAGRFGVSLREA